MSRAKRLGNQGRLPSRPRGSIEPQLRRDRDPAVPDDRLLAKLTQLARFGLAAETAPILAHTETDES